MVVKEKATTHFTFKVKISATRVACCVLNIVFFVFVSLLQI